MASNPFSLAGPTPLQSLDDSSGLDSFNLSGELGTLSNYAQQLQTSIGGGTLTPAQSPLSSGEASLAGAATALGGALSGGSSGSAASSAANSAASPSSSSGFLNQLVNLATGGVSGAQGVDITLARVAAFGLGIILIGIGLLMFKTTQTVIQTGTRKAVQGIKEIGRA